MYANRPHSGPVPTVMPSRVPEPNPTGRSTFRGRTDVDAGPDGFPISSFGRSSRPSGTPFSFFRSRRRLRSSFRSNPKRRPTVTTVIGFYTFDKFKYILPFRVVLSGRNLYALESGPDGSGAGFDRGKSTFSRTITDRRGSRDVDTESNNNFRRL